jgi:hypothetical protein
MIRQPNPELRHLAARTTPDTIITVCGLEITSRWQEWQPIVVSDKAAATCPECKKGG